MHRFDCLSLLGRRRFKEWALNTVPTRFHAEPFWPSVAGNL